MTNTSRFLLAELAIGLVICLAGTPCIAADAVLLDDNFSSYRPGVFGPAEGARTEYHYLRDVAPQGNWVISTFVSGGDSQRAWRVIEADGALAMQQSFTNKMTHTHPMLLTGDQAWSDYTVTVDFTPQSDIKRTGIAFRYQTDRCYYFFGIEGPRIVLMLIGDEVDFHKPFEKVLAEAACKWKSGERLTATATVKGGQLTGTLNGNQVHSEITAKDDAYPSGKVALLADGPTVFHHVKVTTDADTKAAIAHGIVKREAEETQLQAANPKPVVWQKIKTEGFGVGRNLRVGDLDGDGKIDILVGQVRNHGPKDSNSELGCLTALTLDGKQLWQSGTPDAWADKLTSDVALQIHDLDGDGRNEVIYARDFRLTIADGATGRVLRQVDTPETPPRTPPPYNRFPRILGDAILFCDLRGTGRDAEIILKDRYRSIWAFDDQLKVLWHRECTTGHYPFALDTDGDGRDEVLVGYSLFDHNGTPLWTLDGKVKDHADAVMLVRPRPNDPLRVLCAASDEGLFFADTAGNILKRHRIGHAQNITVADLRPDLPGLESLCMTFWGNQGIIHLYDADGNAYHLFEPAQHGSLCMPVNWTGQPGEFFVLSADVREGGMFDGHGRRVVHFPADGHPDMCYAVVDLTGDARDEIVVWDPSEIWIYTQSDNPRSGRLYKPKRNPLHNDSNYRAMYSLPGWSE